MHFNLVVYFQAVVDERKKSGLWYESTTDMPCPKPVLAKDVAAEEAVKQSNHSHTATSQSGLSNRGGSASSVCTIPGQVEDPRIGKLQAYMYCDVDGTENRSLTSYTRI